MNTSVNKNGMHPHSALLYRHSKRSLDIPLPHQNIPNQKTAKTDAQHTQQINTKR